MNGDLYGFGDDIYAIYQAGGWYMYSNDAVSNQSNLHVNYKF